MAEEGEVCEMKFCFGDIVVVEGNLRGVVVKAWINGKRGHLSMTYMSECTTELLRKYQNTRWNDTW